LLESATSFANSVISVPFAAKRPAPAGAVRLEVVTRGLSTAVGQVAYALIPSILGTVRDLAGELRAVLGVCIGLQLAAMMMALGSLSKRSSLRKADQDGGGH
jgi:hypothetical protein